MQKNATRCHVLLSKNEKAITKVNSAEFIIIIIIIIIVVVIIVVIIIIVVVIIIIIVVIIIIIMCINCTFATGR